MSDSSHDRPVNQPSPQQADAKPSANNWSYGQNKFSQPHLKAVAPLEMVETAFLASAASLIWFVNFYFPLGPLLRIFFPVPIALVYLRWGSRAAWMAALVSGLLLSVLMGPTRSILFVMPYGLLGVLLGSAWRRRSPWAISIGLTGIVLIDLVTFATALLTLLLLKSLNLLL